MEIIIRRVDNHFQFTTDKKTIFYGKFVVQRFKIIKQLYQDKKLVTESVFKFRLPFQIMYSIKFIEKNQTISLKYTNIFNPKFICHFNNDTYEIIPHKGLKTSIFKNDIQIGYYIEKRVEYFGGQTISLVTNDDISKQLIFTFMLAIKCNFQNDYSSASIDIGNFGPEARKFDSSWKPSNTS